MDIIRRIKNDEEVFVEEVINIDIDMIEELFCDNKNYAIYKKLFDYCITHTETDNSKILYLIGLMYDCGKGVEQNYIEAIKYYKIACEKGSGDALFNLGFIYHHAKGVEQNIDEAIKYYKMDKNVVIGITMVKFGDRRCSGDGVEQNYEEAIKYYRIALELGTEKAKTNLLDLINKINELSTTEKIEYYNILNQCEITKEYAKKIIIKQETDDIVQMYNIIEELKQEVKELRTHVEYMPDGIGYQEAKAEFETLQQK